MIFLLLQLTRFFSSTRSSALTRGALTALSIFLVVGVMMKTPIVSSTVSVTVSQAGLNEINLDQRGAKVLISNDALDATLTNDLGSALAFPDTAMVGAARAE